MGGRFQTESPAVFVRNTHSGLFLILGVSITHIATTFSGDILETTIENQMEARAMGRISKIDKALYERALNMKMMVGNLLSDTKNPSPKLIGKRLDEILKESEYFTSLSFFDMSRKRIADTSGQELGKVHSANEYWPEIESGKDIVIGMYLSESLKIPLFHIAKVVRDKSGVPMGVLVGRISAQMLSEIMKLRVLIQPYDKVLDEENLMNVELVDKTGLIVYSNHNESAILKKTSKYWKYLKDDVGREILYKGYRLQLPGMDEEIVTYGHETGYKDFKGNEWTLIIHVPSKVVFAPATALRNKLILYMASFGVFSLLAILLFARTISHPLMRLSAAAEEIGQGNLGVKVAVASNDEVAKLSKNLNSMTEKLFTSRKALEKSKEEAELSRDAAENATKLKDKFVILVSHDLRGPLSTMLGFLKLLHKDMDAARSGEKLLVKSAIKSGENMIGLINDILDISRIKHGKITPKLTFADVYFVAVKVFATLADQAEQKKITLINRLPREMSLYTDAELLGQILQNLISNAIKFCHQGGSVTLYSPKGEPATIAVSDTGVGISPERLKTLFSYDKAKSTIGTDLEEGTGFGLPLSQEIANALGGLLTVESAPGVGTTFYIRLAQVRPRILIVDDDAFSREIIRKYLADMEMECFEAGNGKEALDIIRKSAPHLVITDLKMPVMDGFELLVHMKKDCGTKHVPVVAITSDCLAESREQVLHLKADDYINKDIDQSEFLPRIARLLSINPR